MVTLMWMFYLCIISILVFICYVGRAIRARKNDLKRIKINKLKKKTECYPKS